MNIILPIKIIGPSSLKKSSNIVAIVVTYNRKALILRCLDCLLRQSLKADILIIDNASTDGTEFSLMTSRPHANQSIYYLRLNKNMGGAGGFHYGLKTALKNGWEWFWLMDDDACPRHNALEMLFSHLNEENAVYGSAPVYEAKGEVKLCFPVKKCVNHKSVFIENYRMLGPKEEVEWLPFLGLLIHKKNLLKVGLPDKSFFIRNDDVEYAERAKRRHIKNYMIRESVIDHPLESTTKFVLLGKQIYYRKMPTWKMYYEVRNKILLSKRYYSIPLMVKVLSGVSLQVLISIIKEKDKKGYISSYYRGIRDGIFDH